MKIEFDNVRDGIIKLSISIENPYQVCSEDEADFNVDLKIESSFFDLVKDSVQFFSYYDDKVDIETFNNYFSSVEKINEFYSKNIYDNFDYEWKATNTTSFPEHIEIINCHQRGNCREPIFSYEFKKNNSSKFYGDNILKAAGIYNCIEEYLTEVVFMHLAKEIVLNSVK